MAKIPHYHMFLFFEGGCRTTVMTPGQLTQSANCPEDKLDKLKNILEIEFQNL